MLKFIFFVVILSFVILSFVIQIMLFLLSLYFVLFFLGVLIYFLWFNIVLHFENSFLIEKQVISPQVHKIKYNAQYLQMIGLFYCLHSHPHNFSPPNNSFVTLDKFLIFSQLLQFTIYWSFFIFNSLFPSYCVKSWTTCLNYSIYNIWKDYKWQIRKRIFYHLSFPGLCFSIVYQ